MSSDSNSSGSKPSRSKPSRSKSSKYSSHKYSSHKYSSQSEKTSQESMVYGVNTLETMLQHTPDRVLHLLYIPSAKGRLPQAKQAILDLAISHGIEVSTARDRQIEHYLPNVQHQGMMAFVTSTPLLSWAEICHVGHRRLIALDQVTDPRNFGAILRSAEVFGIDGVLITSNRCARPGPVVARTSVGASELIPIAMETNLGQALEYAKHQGFTIIGADMEGQPAQGVDWNGPVVLVIGAEGKGLRSKTRQVGDELVSLPQIGKIESLNASVAASLLIYEAQRAQLFPQ